jgi:hypothetical protein
MLKNFINPMVFIIAFIIGVGCVYILQPESIKVMRFPNPENAGKFTYQDENTNCYKYKATEVKCPSDPNLILEHPLIIK